MSASLQLALVQFDINWENRNANIAQLEKLLQHEVNCDLILLPEMWSTGFSMRTETVSESEPGPALSWMIAYSQKLNSAIAGSVAVEVNGQYYNRLYFVHPEGRVDHYDKKHLFSYGKEDHHYTPGNERKVIDYKGWKIMPVICYDLRFPVWIRNNLNYDLMIIVANWPAPRIHHWDALLKARAIENQCYLAAVNRVGKDGNGLEYPGHSAVIDMNGMPLISMDDGAGVVKITIEKEDLDRYREHYRFLQDQDAFRL